MSGKVYYEEDVTGENPVNLIVREPHVISVINPETKDVLVPNFPPFFPKDFSIEVRDAAGVYTPLTAGTAESGADFELVLPWYSFEKETGKHLFGGAKMHRKPSESMIYVTYRTFGGKHTADRNLVLMALANYVWNPRIVQFDQLTNIQETFPPNQHQQNLMKFVGWENVEAQMGRIVEVLAQKAEPTLLFQQQTLALLKSNDELRRIVENRDATIQDLSRRLTEIERRL